MRNRKKEMRKSDTKHIPLQLCEEILARMSVRDLLRFRCVYKSWRSIIDSSIFTSMHLNLYKNNNDHKNVLLGVDKYTTKPTLCLLPINKFFQIGEKIEIHIPR